MSIMENIKFLDVLKEYKTLLKDENCFNDTIEIEDKLNKIQCLDNTLEYFVVCRYGIVNIFKYYSRDLDFLLEIASIISLDYEFNDCEVVIYTTTEFGGRALYNQSPLGMIRNIKNCK